MKKSMLIALISGVVTVVAATGVTFGVILGGNDSEHSGEDKCNHTYVSEVTKEATCKEEGILIFRLCGQKRDIMLEKYIVQDFKKMLKCIT